jgi:hypothetical protein
VKERFVEILRDVDVIGVHGPRSHVPSTAAVKGRMRDPRIPPFEPPFQSAKKLIGVVADGVGAKWEQKVLSRWRWPVTLPEVCSTAYNIPSEDDLRMAAQKTTMYVEPCRRRGSCGAAGSPTRERVETPALSP